jgi:hypothetical protein
LKDAREISSKYEDRYWQCKQELEALAAASKVFRHAFTYDPGHSDLDNEQPIHITVTLGDWRRLDWALRPQSEPSDI